MLKITTSPSVRVMRARVRLISNVVLPEEFHKMGKKLAVTGKKSAFNRLKTSRLEKFGVGEVSVFSPAAWELADRTNSKTKVRFQITNYSSHSAALEVGINPQRMYVSGPRAEYRPFIWWTKFHSDVTPSRYGNNRYIDVAKGKSAIRKPGVRFMLAGKKSVEKNFRKELEITVKKIRRRI